MKKAICAQARVQARAQRVRHLLVAPQALDMAGSSAAETDIPNRLTGSV